MTGRCRFPTNIRFPGLVDASAQQARLGVFADAYGLDEAARHRLLDRLPRRPAAMADLLTVAGGRDGTQPWARLWREGHGRTWSAVAAHVRAHRTTWRRAVLG